MKLRPIASNQNEITTTDYIVLFSYETPVAAEHRSSGKCYRTAKKWSQTTSRHINSWLEGREAIPISQSEIDSLV